MCGCQNQIYGFANANPVVEIGALFSKKTTTFQSLFNLEKHPFSLTYF